MPRVGRDGRNYCHHAGRKRVLREPTTASRKRSVGLDWRPFSESGRPERLEEFRPAGRSNILRHEAADFGREFESVTAEPDRDEQSLGTDPIQDRIRVRRHVIRARPSAPRLRLRHPRESLRESHADIPDGGGGERLVELVLPHLLLWIRIHLFPEGGLYPFP